MESREDFVQQFREKQLAPDDLFKDIQEVKEKLAEVRELLQPRNVRSNCQVQLCDFKKL